MRAFAEMLWAVLRDPGALLLLLVAPVLYSFFYPWPYTTQAVTRVPVAIVDLDHTSLSRQIVRFAQASPRLDLRFVSSDEQAARTALQRREIEGYAVLPAELKRGVVHGTPVVVPVLGNGAYFLINKTVLSGFGEAVGTVSAGAELKSLQARGQPPPQAAASRSPVNVQLLPLFNTTEGYGSYVVPAVSVLIIHQLLLIGSALVVGTRFERPVPAEGHGAWLARIAALALFGLLAGGYFFGWVHGFFGYAHGGNPAGTAALLLPFSWSVAALGVLLGALFADRERAMQALLATSLPIAFIAGFSWPLESLPAPLRALGALVPAVPGIQGFLRLNQMGAAWRDVQGYAAELGALALGFTLLALWAVRWRARHPAATVVRPDHLAGPSAG